MMCRYMKGRPIGIIGHITTHYGQRLIADAIAFPKTI